MFEYTRSQHFQFGYAKPQRPLTDENVSWMSRRQAKDEIFVAKYGRAETKLPSWRVANKQAAIAILEDCRRRSLTPLVCYSGGLDSEIALVAFLEARKETDPDFPISVVTLYLDGDLNSHDTKFVEIFKSRLSDFGFSEKGLTFYRRQLNAIDFWNSEEFLALAKETQIVSPIVLCQLWLCAEMLKENPQFLPIIGQGEIHLVKDTSERYVPGVSPYTPTVWRIVETENLCGMYRYFIKRGAPAIPGFFQYLPEQFESQLRTNSVIHELLSHCRVGKLGTRSSKREIVMQDYPELESRPKFHGFETIEAAHDLCRKRLGELMPECEAHWYQDVFSLYQNLRPNLKGPFTHKDWSFALGRDGELFQQRRDCDDIFASEWHTRKNTPPEIPLNDVFKKAEEALVEFVKTSEPCTLLHDGSLVARWIHGLCPGLPLVGAATVSRMRSHEIVTDVFETDICDSGSMLLYRMAKMLKGTNGASRILIPRLHSRMETSARTVWIESEREARLAFGLRKLFDESNLALPYCNSGLLESVQHAVAALTQKFGTDAWTTKLKERVSELETRSDAPESGHLVYQAEIGLRKIDSCFFSLANPSVATMNSSFVWPITDAKIGTGLDGLDRTILASGLTPIPIDEWLRWAKFGAPDLKLGGNLFYRQTVHGFGLIAKNFRQAVALKSQRGETICVACIQILDSEPNGTLRIRGVTTPIEFRRKGHASKLLRSIANALRSNKEICERFSKVEVWAATEVVPAFETAGFIKSNDLDPRDEPVYLVAENKLATSGRVLQPMILPLNTGPANDQV